MGTHNKYILILFGVCTRCSYLIYAVLLHVVALSLKLAQPSLLTWLGLAQHNIPYPSLVQLSSSQFSVTWRSVVQLSLDSLVQPNLTEPNQPSLAYPLLFQLSLAAAVLCFQTQTSALLCPVRLLPAARIRSMPTSASVSMDTRERHVLPVGASLAQLSLAQLSYLSYPILSYPILPYPILSYPTLSYPSLSYPTLSDPILSYPIPPYPILSFPILSYLNSAQLSLAQLSIS